MAGYAETAANPLLTATQAVPLPGTLNLSTVETYSFAITATVSGDGNSSDYLLTPAPTRTMAGTLSQAAAVTIAVMAAQVGTRVTIPLNYALAAGDCKRSNYVGAWAASAPTPAPTC